MTAVEVPRHEALAALPEATEGNPEIGIFAIRCSLWRPHGAQIMQSLPS